MIKHSALALTAIALGIAVATTACAPRLARQAERETAPPVPAQCASQCLDTCLPERWPQWTGEPTAAETWDLVPEQLLDPLRTIAEDCDVARASCVACLRRLEAAGLICAVAAPCGPRPNVE